MIAQILNSVSVKLGVVRLSGKLAHSSNHHAFVALKTACFLLTDCALGYAGLGCPDVSPWLIRFVITISISVTGIKSARQEAAWEQNARLVHEERRHPGGDAVRLPNAISC